MDEIYIGFIIVVIVILTIKTINIYHNYKNTIYPQIYSGFIEFLYRKASIKRLSTSSWIEQNFGFHRIIYYTDKTNKKRFQKFFIILIMSSGVYVINSKNLRGKVYLDKGKKYKFITSFINKETKEYGNKTIDLPDPLKEIENFVEVISRATQVCDIYQLIQFLDGTEIDIKQSKIPMICSKDFFLTIENLHKHSQKELGEVEIETIYSQINEQLYKFIISYTN